MSSGSPDPGKPTTFPPVALTIAGSDSGGGAGIQADLKTFSALRVHGASVITLVTAQNTTGVRAIELMPLSLVEAQFQAVVEDLSPSVFKTGALGGQEMIRMVSNLTQGVRPRLVVDPVMVSKHGHALLPDEAIRIFARTMVEGVLVITPNRHEAQALAKRRVEGLDSMKDAARAIFDLGPQHVLIKGSHFDKVVRDIFYDGSGFVEFGADRIESKHVHGSGCTHSAAITAYLAHGDGLLTAIEKARLFISEAIRGAHEIGQGISPVNPAFAWWKPQT